MYVVWTGNNEGCVGGGAIEVREGGGGGRVYVHIFRMLAKWVSAVATRSEIGVTDKESLEYVNVEAAKPCVYA